MYSTFIFELSAEVPASRKTVVFCAYPGVDEDLVFEDIKSYFSSAPVTEELLFLGTESVQPIIKRFLEVPELRDRLTSVTRYVNPPPLGALIIKSEGTFFQIGLHGEDLTKDTFISRLRTEGLLKIFTIRNGLLDPKGLHHYSKPAGKHSDKFIRTANVLVRGAEVRFLAFWLLPYLYQSPPYIYTDTASIDAVAYASVELLREMREDYVFPKINSFGSYAGLEEFKFEADSQSLFIISASTSGGLEASLRKKRVSGKIITIYYLGNNESELCLLCNLTKSEENKMGYERIQSFEHNKCPYCLQGQPFVSLIGDQFLPEPLEHQVVQLSKDDRPNWLNGFMKDYAGSQLIKCHYDHPNAGPEPREIHLNIEKALTEKSSFIKKVTDALTKMVPAATSRIIALDDPSSDCLAKIVQKEIQKTRPGAQNVEIVKATELTRSPKNYETNSGASFVVAGVLITGRRLMAVSQVLRQVQKNDAIQYFVGISRCRSEDLLQEIRTNLQYGNSRPEQYPFTCITSVFLNDDPPSRISPWESETHLWREIVERSGNNTEITKRLDDIQRRGLVQNLYLPKCNNQQELRIRNNFAFWNFRYEAGEITQADVYFTMSAVLHGIRNGIRNRPARLRQEHRRAVLSPRCFDRFNDGVVQASLLRAALPIELDYSANSHLSEEMSRVLEFIFGHSKNEHGEASSEFLLALAAKKIQLQRHHLERVVACAEHEGIQDVLANALIAYIKNEIVKK